MSLSALVSARTVPNDLAAWSVVSIQFLTVVAASLTGVAFVRALPVVVAVPAAGGLWFFWLAYGPSSTNRLLHNMDPGLTGCCASNSQPARGAVIAILVLVAAISGGILFAVMPRRWANARRMVVAPITAATIVFAFCASAGIAVASIDELTFTATEPRTTALVCRRTDDIEVCVWPESADQTEGLIRSAQGVNERFRKWGLPEVARLSERDAGPEWIAIVLDPRSTRQELTQSIVSGYIDQVAGCTGTYGVWTEEREAFMLLSLGAGRSDVEYGRSPEMIAEAEKRIAAATADPTAVRDWFLADRDRVHCNL